ncbi:hypothetical protein BuS5_03840 [Desulfosarcina sp. BuS5]|nr:hypothetical protein BuS5_03840 [Desulfosarcina sp. BuS5]
MMQNKRRFRPDPKAKLMDQVKEVLRYHHYAYRTEVTYCQWIVRYIHYYGGKTHPREMGRQQVEAFLSNLVGKKNVAASTQRQALNALVFLYREVLDMPIEGEMMPIRSKKKVHPPTVLTKEEVQGMFLKLKGTHLLMAKLLYGAGLRLMECIRLRIQDVDFGQNKIYVRGGKGGKDRLSVLPQNIRDELRFHIDRVIVQHHEDLVEGFGAVYLPHALDRKYPNAARETGWQYVFPAKKRSIDPRSGREMRHHVLETGLQKAVKRAVTQSGIHKKAGCHTLRHSFATHMLENGINIRVLQTLMGHADVKTTEIYTHVMKKDIDAIESPLDQW